MAPEPGEGPGRTVAERARPEAPARMGGEVVARGRRGDRDTGPGATRLADGHAHARPARWRRDHHQCGDRRWRGRMDDSAIVVHELATGQRTVLVNGGTDARVLPTGHLVYSRAATLFAVLFDEARLVVAGGAVPVQQGIQPASSAASGAAQRAWSDAGAFVFVPGSTTSIDRALVWINRQGKEQARTCPIEVIGFSEIACVCRRTARVSPFLSSPQRRDQVLGRARGTRRRPAVAPTSGWETSPAARWPA